MKKNKQLCSAIVLTVLSVIAYGQEYNAVDIGGQRWMTENLNVSRFRNGDAIPEAKTYEDWYQAATSKQPAWCYYDNDPANGKKYGKIYNWYAVNDERGLAPSGWHVPTDDEWKTLTDFLGGEVGAGIKMKAKAGWNSNKNGSNSSGFAGLPGGACTSSGSFSYKGDIGKWWTATESSATYAWLRVLGYVDGDVSRPNLDKANGLSVRCVKD